MNVFDLPEDHWLRAAHKKSIRHRNEVEKSDECGCFHCLQSFTPTAITDWTDGPEIENQTALCPFCGIDSVVGSASGYTITPDFLTKLQAAWFGNQDK